MVAGLPSLDAALDYICIRVKDNGIGFDDKYSEKMFSFFYRHEKSQDYPGEGIGLALCKKIVQNHNAVIFVNSSKGHVSVYSGSASPRSTCRKLKQESAVFSL
jgi:light-regulated signal transduction histidine kinase (bacteriophytochrome)